MTRQMKHYNFPIRNFDGTFYEQVHPFDPTYFAVKVNPTGALLFTPHHSQLTLLQHIIIQSPFLKQPVLFLSDIPKYWIEDDGTMCLGRGMGSPIPRAQEGAWACEGPKVVGGGFTIRSVDPFDLEP